MFPELVQDWLYAQHEELISEVKSELQVLLAWPIVEDGIDERHEGSLETDVVAVLARGPVQVGHDALE